MNRPLSDNEIDTIIESIERDWYANGFCGEVRHDSGFPYELANRVNEYVQSKLSLGAN